MSDKIFSAWALVDILIDDKLSIPIKDVCGKEILSIPSAVRVCQTSYISYSVMLGIASEAIHNK